MNSKRESVSQALFVLLQNTNWGSTVVPNGFVTASRQARIPSSVSPGDQPALFLVKLEEDIAEAQAFGAPSYKLKYKALIYFRGTGDPQQVNETQVNTILDAADGILLASQENPQTLGGLVVSAWIDGRVFIETGILDPQCWVEMPVSVLTFI